MMVEANIWSCINKLTLVLCFSFYDPSVLRGWSFWTSKTEGQILDFDKFAKRNTIWFESSGSQPAAPSYNFLMPTINLNDIDEKSFIWFET